MAVNDLLVAASLVPGAGGEARAGELVSANMLAELLRQVSGAVETGRDPVGVLAGTGYRADEPLGARLARLALLNLAEPARTLLAGDPLFTRLLGSDLLGEALFAATGEELFFVNTGVVAAVDQVLLARVPTIAGLLVAGRDLVSRLEGQAAQLPAGVLELPDRSGVWRLHQARTVGELVRWRLEQARARFEVIAAEVQEVLDLGDRAVAGKRLRALTRRWSEAMHKLGGVAAAGGDSGSPQVPVLTKRLFLDMPRLSLLLAAPLQVADRPGRRAAGVGLDDYLAPVNSLLAWPVLPPFRLLAAGLGSDPDRARFWELVRGEGGILVRTGPDPGLRLLYLRAVRHGGDRVFAFRDPERSRSQVVGLSQITDWARPQAARVHDAYLPGNPAAGSTPAGLWESAHGAAHSVEAYLAGDPAVDLGVWGQRAALRSLLGGPPAPGGGFRRLALRLLRAVRDQVLPELFDDGGELVAVLLARIPEGDWLRGELDDILGRLARDGRPALAEDTMALPEQEPLAFRPGHLDVRLEGVGPPAMLSEQEVGRVIGVMARADPERMIRQLGRLPLAQRSRAGQWLAGARVRIGSRAARAAQAGAGDTREALSVLTEALAWVYRDAAAQVPDVRGASAWPVPVATRSGFYLPGPAAGEARAADEVAAQWFPPVAGAVVWHVHLDPVTGYVLAGDRSLTPLEFYVQVMGACQWPQTLLVLVGCWAARVAARDDESAAQALAWLGGGPVLAADTVAWTTAGGQMLAAGEVGVDAEGLPVLTSPGNWVLVRRDGQEQQAAGPDLLDILGRDDGLPEELLDGARPRLATGEELPRPARAVRWGDGLASLVRLEEVITTADLSLPAGRTTGAPRPAGATRGVGGQVEAAGLRRELIATRSGYFVPAGLGGDAADGDEGLAAAQSFLAVDGATVLHVHVDSSGNLLTGSRALAPAEFHELVVRDLDEPPAEVLILVACAAAGARAEGQAAAAVLAGLGGRPVLAADADVFTVGGGRVVTARSGVDAQGRVVVDTARPGTWRLFTANGQSGDDLGDDLVGVLDDESGALAASLPAQVAVPVMRGRPDYPPTRPDVRWSDAERGEGGDGSAPVPGSFDHGYLSVREPGGEVGRWLRAPVAGGRCLRPGAGSRRQRPVLLPGRCP